MRAELGKAEHHIVFVIGPEYGVADGQVMVYKYEGLNKVSTDTFSIGFARTYWKVLVTRGYHVIPSGRFAPPNCIEDIQQLLPKVI